MTIASSDIFQWSIASSEDYQSSDDGLESSIPPLRPFIPTTQRHIDTSSLNSYSHILTVPTHIRTPYLKLQAQSKELTISKDDAFTVFAHIHSPSHPTYDTEMEILSKVERLTIEDLEGANAIANANHPPVQSDDSALFKNLRTLSLGRALTETILEDAQRGSDNSTVKKVINILGLILKPTHICVSQPGGTEDPENDFWQIEVLEEIKSILFSGKVKSWTSDGFCFYDPFFVPPTIEDINMRFPDCPLPLEDNQFKCACHAHLLDVVDAITRLDIGEIDSQLEGTRLNLVNLPHLSPRDMTTEALAEIKIKVEGGTPLVEVDDGIEVDLRENFRKMSHWIEGNFKVVRKEDAGGYTTNRNDSEKSWVLKDPSGTI